MSSLYREFDAGIAQDPVLTPLGPANPYHPQKKIFEGANLGDLITLPFGSYRVLKNGNAETNPNELQQENSASIARGAGTSNSDAQVPVTLVGSTKLTFNTGIGTIVADRYAGGFVTTLDTVSGTLRPIVYPVISNTATSSSDNNTTLTLGIPLKRPAGSGTAIQLVSSPFANTQRGESSSDSEAGVTLVAVPANYYWLGLVTGYVSLRFAADFSAAATAKKIHKVGDGEVAISNNHGHRPIGYILGNQAVANTDFGRYAICYINLLG